MKDWRDCEKMKIYWVKQKNNHLPWCNMLVKFKGEIYVDRYNCVGKGHIEEGEVVGEFYEGLSHEHGNQIMPHIELYEGVDLSDMEEVQGQKSKYWDRAIIKEE